MSLMAAAGAASSAAFFAADSAAATVVLVGLLASERRPAAAAVEVGVAAASEARFLFAAPAPLLFANLTIPLCSFSLTLSCYESSAGIVLVLCACCQ
jgi:hypothetical protein